MFTSARPLTLAAGLALGVSLGTSATAAPGSPARARAHCKKVADPTTLIPDGANVIVSVDGKKTFRSALYRDLRTALDRDLELKDGLAVLDACGLGLEDIRDLTAGVGPDEQTVAIIDAKNIGTSQTLTCLRDRLAARKDGKRPWTMRREGCYRVLSHDGKDFGFVLDDSTIVLTQNGWGDEVRGLVSGKGKSAATTGSAGTLASIDRGKSMWFSMALTDRDRSGLQGSAAAQLQSISGALDFARGLDLGARLLLADPGSALQMRDELKMYRDLISGMGALPDGMADRVKLDARDRGVDVSVALSATDLERLREALEPHTQGKNPL
jgi:hypothetical protein